MTLINPNDVAPMSDDEMPGGAGASDFWDSRPVLKHVAAFARARRVGPWGVLGCVLVRTICQIPPEIGLPPIVGGRMSLNMNVVLVGGSGEGKGGCEAVARQAVIFDPGHYIQELPIGSGEGVARTFMTPKDDDDNYRPDPAIFTASEINTIAALFTRRGTTVEAELRKLYCGEMLGFSNAQSHTRTKVSAHSYRAGVIVGAQPGRADCLLKNVDGGTPQRFLWLPVDDPAASPQRPDELQSCWVTIPAMFSPGYMPDPGFRVNGLSDLDISVPQRVRDEMDEFRVRVLHRDPSVDPLDGHRMVCQLKVAVALAFLDGRREPILHPPTGVAFLDARRDPNDEPEIEHVTARGEVTLEDWELAAQVMAVSDQTREMVLAAGKTKARQTARARAAARDEEDQYISERRQARLIANLSRTLRDGGGEVISRSDLRRGLRSDERSDFEPAMAALVKDELAERVTLPRGIGYKGGQNL